MTKQDHFNEQLIAYALDALDPGEVRDLEEHLNTCTQCQSELEAWHESSALLAFASEEAEPNPNVRDRILAEAATIRRGDQSAMPSADEFSSESYRPQRVVREFPWWRTAPGITAIAACTALLVVSAFLFTLWKRERQLNSQVTTLTRRLDDQDQELARVKKQNELLSDPAARAITLLGTNMAPNASAKIMLDRRTGRAMLIAYNLPSVPAGKAYQLWFIADGKPLRGLTFTPDRDGRATTEYETPEAGRNASLFAVTLEPEGGVPSPTGDKYLLSTGS